jgi:hypothetical protein
VHALARPPQDRGDPVLELAVGEGLRDVVVRAELEAAHAIELGGAPRQDHQRQRRVESRGDPVGRPHLADQLEPRAVREPDVDHGEVGALVLQRAQGVASRVGHEQLVAVGGQVVGEKGPDDRVVLDQKQGCSIVHGPP